MEAETIRSRIDELSSIILTNSGDDSVVSSSDSKKLLEDCFQDAYMDRFRDELRMTEAEGDSLAKEIDHLKKSCTEWTCQLESNLELLHHVAKNTGSEEMGLAEIVEHNKLKSGEDQPEAKALHEDYLEVLKLKHQIEKNNITLNSMQDLDYDLKRIEAIENIEEALTGLKVIDFEENTIKVSLKTYIPEGVMCQLNAEDYIKQSEVNHELLIEVVNGTMDLKNVEIFPNDVYIGEIAEATKTFSKLFTVVPQTRSSLGWFLQKVQDRIAMCTIRQLVVKSANKSRHSFEYLDKDELIIAHMNGGIDAFIKPSQGWPLSASPLKLVSFRSSNQNSKDISLSLLSKVEEMANSFDLNIRESITNFVDGIEEILLEQMRP
ncbi:uncharacterized protein [Spinacia oleracea]|uniref:Uncharacterized protein isoform X2 n=1 Tax=Spinacia oleracea TaxID=3562 RepID=A0A9R0IV50_SPIOL|nr:uncharacterized protein LOC110795391 isoform X2 [Spinacia oleracea]